MVTLLAFIRLKHGKHYAMMQFFLIQEKKSANHKAVFPIRQLHCNSGFKLRTLGLGLDIRVESDNAIIELSHTDILKTFFIKTV